MGKEIKLLYIATRCKKTTNYGKRLGALNYHQNVEISAKRRKIIRQLQKSK